MATYMEIQAYVEIKYGFVLDTCWISEVKELPLNCINQKYFLCFVG
jgi:hypothetical protein